jgi:UDP-N-acetylmuramoyl-tripeptide--D-alanyl-D-alanine ligase
MLELGAASAGAHGGIGRLLAASKADMVFFFGPETGAAAEALASAGTGRKTPWFHTGSMSGLSRALKEYIRAGDLVLLKGSRGCALERLMEADSAGEAALVPGREG